MPSQMIHQIHIIRVESVWTSAQNSSFLLLTESQQLGRQGKSCLGGDGDFESLNFRQKISWLKYCVGKAGTEISSEESSEIIMPANGADWMSTKAEDANSIDGAPLQSPTTIMTTTGSGRFRNRNATNPEATPMLTQQLPILHTYTVLIEYKDGETKRPSVRLSSCDSDCYTLDLPKV